MLPSARRAALLALAFAACAAAPPLTAQEAPKAGGTAAPADPVAAYEAARKPLLAQVAGRIESVASFAMGNKLKRTGIDLFREVLEHDPDNAKARRELGFDRKGEEWAANEAKQKKLEDLEDESEKKRPELERKLKDARTGAAKTLAELGDLADKASRPEDSQDLWKKALLQDDQNALANERMGNKLVEGKWLTDRAIRHREFVKVYEAALAQVRKLDDKTVKLEACEETTGLLTKAGLQEKRLRSPNFRIESVLPEAAIRATLIELERARQFFLDLYQVPERFLDYKADPIVFVVTTKDDQKEKVIDACDQIPAKEKSFKKKFGSTDVTVKLYLAMWPDEATARTYSVHTATHTFGKHSFGSHAPWLFDALANSVAAAVMKVRLIACFSGEGSTAGINVEQMDLQQAPGVLHEVVRKGTDTPIGDFVKLPADAMPPKDIAKAWSVLMYLLERDRTQTREYLLRAGQGGGQNSRDEAILKEYFPEFPTWKDLDEAWREWALDVYKEAK